MNVRLTQLDGKLPNLALMRISAFHKRRGDEVHFTFSPRPSLFEPEVDRVYGSCIFKFNRHRADELRSNWPDAFIGGSGVEDYDLVQIGGANQLLVEDVLGDPAAESDYSLYPAFDASIGFTQRGCRLKCGFCGVPGKEGENRSVSTVHNVWRGPGFPKKLHLLDNDFFGQPDWRSCVEEIVTGGFRVCLNQGINVRFITDEAAEALSHMEYRDDQFQRRRLYTAWDNPKQEKLFFAGVDCLERHGIPPIHLMVYMLTGYWPDETWERIWWRFNKMVERGIKPYVMVFDRSRADLVCFQRWVNTGLYRIVPWPEYRRETKTAASVQGWEAALRGAA
jgi:hypothetical protein